MRRTVRWLVYAGVMLLGGAAAGRAAAADRPVVAVLDLVEHAGVDPGTGSFLAEEVRAALHASDEVDLVEREQLDKVMAEQRLQLSGLCEATSCSVEIGKLLGVPFVWGGSVGKLGSHYRVTLQVVNVTTAEVDRLTRIRARSLDELVDKMTGAAHELLAGDPDRARAVLERGQALYRREAYADAAAAFARATELQPRDAAAWTWRARALKKLGRTEEGAEASARAAALAAADRDRRGHAAGDPVLTDLFGAQVNALAPWWEPPDAQRDFADANDLPLAFENGQGYRMVLIPPGTFEMGSPPDESERGKNEGPVHSVSLPREFYVGATEVTNGQYRRFRRDHSSMWAGAEQPVEMVSWDAAQAYCVWLTETERQAGTLPAGWAYRLPTEAQWEYGCRAGSRTAYSFGSDATAFRAHGWYDGNSQSRTHPVGQKRANGWGLYDMHGNVDEWCQSWLKAYPYHADDGRESSTGMGNRVYRGGSWRWGPQYCRSAFRGGMGSNSTGDNSGFRVVLAPAAGS